MRPRKSSDTRSTLDPLRIVLIGGGTGLSMLLRGLKKFASSPAIESAGEGVGQFADLTAVVAVSDDGGSSGRLRREFDVLPPGDIRNCMVALSEDEALLSRLFQYRFSAGHGLKGHSFGNLFLTALNDLTGDFQQAVRLSSEILAIRGRIFPATSQKVVLEARLANGKTVAGETRISRSSARIERITLVPPDTAPLAETLRAIAAADLITLGPGSLFTSVIPNLLVSGIPRAIARSRAVKAYFMNLMWQPGETEHFDATEHVRAIREHAGRNILDYVVVNSQPIPRKLLARYAAQRARPVECDWDRIERLGVSVVGAELLADSDMVRHDPDLTASLAIKLAKLGRRRAILRERRAQARAGKLT